VTFEQVRGGCAPAAGLREDLADVPPQESRVGDGATQEVGLKAAAEAFNFGELGHREGNGQWGWAMEGKNSKRKPA
jgi:hypothetical protein